jgi:hypothetical protein
MADVEQVEWADHLRTMRERWAHGEHVTGIGHNGCGKSTLMRHLLWMRSYVVALGTKPTTPGRLDPVLAGLNRHDGYKRVHRVPQLSYPPPRSARYLLWPDYTDERDIADQKRELHRAIMQAFRDGSWTLAIDEVAYVARQLRLDLPLVTVLTQGRSQQVGMVGMTQRPSHIPLEFYTEPAYLYAWRCRNGNDLRRLGNLAGAVDVKLVIRTLQNLPKHHVLWCHLHTGDMHVTLPPPL